MYASMEDEIRLYLRDNYDEMLKNSRKSVTSSNQIFCTYFIKFDLINKFYKRR